MRLYDWITNLPLDWPNLLIIGGMIILAQFIGIGDLKKRVKRIEEVLHKLTMSFHTLLIKVESAFQGGFEMDTINRVISIELRDFIFQREGRNITEIDKHDPDRSDT